MRKLIIFVLVVGVLLVAADRIGDVVAERLTADKLQSSQGLQQRPDVDIDGIPFLTQLASGHYQHIEITARDVQVASTSLYLTTLVANLRTVSVPRTFSSFTAKTATASATVGFAELSRLLGVQVAYGGDGTLTFTKTLPLLGTRTVRFRASYVNGALRFGQATIDGLKSFSAEVGAVLGRALSVRTPLSDFPLHVTVRSVDVDRSGLEIALAGSNLSYGG